MPGPTTNAATCRSQRTPWSGRKDRGDSKCGLSYPRRIRSSNDPVPPPTPRPEGRGAPLGTARAREDFKSRQAARVGGPKGMALGRDPQAGRLEGPCCDGGGLRTQAASRGPRLRIVTAVTDSASGAPGRDEEDVDVHPRRGHPRAGGQPQAALPRARRRASATSSLKRASPPRRKASASGGVRSRDKPRLRVRRPKAREDIAREGPKVRENGAFRA